MVPEAERFAPKVHPATRPVEPEDPLTLHATAVAGDPEVMLHCLVQEYASMGWDAEEILRLFRDPFYPALHSLWCFYGEAGLRERLIAVFEQTATFHLDEAVREEAELVEAEPELVQLGIRARPSEPANYTKHTNGESHAAGL
jgi:hypothetical protein